MGRKTNAIRRSFEVDLNTTLYVSAFTLVGKHGRKLQGRGGRVSQNFEWRTLIQIVPPDLL